MDRMKGETVPRGCEAEGSGGRSGPGVAQGNQGGLEDKHLSSNEAPPGFLFELPSFLEGSVLSMGSSCCGLRPESFRERETHTVGNSGPPPQGNTVCPPLTQAALSPTAAPPPTFVTLQREPVSLDKSSAKHHTCLPDPAL